jgi:hypothetical protein
MNITSLLAAVVTMIIVIAATDDIPPAQPPPSFQERFKTDRDKFDRDMKLDTKRPWDGTRPGQSGERDPAPPNPEPAKPRSIE